MLDRLPGDPSYGRPKSPTHLSKEAWSYALARTVQQFKHNELTEVGATLSFYFLLAFLPAAVAVVSVLGVFGQGPETVTGVLQILRQWSGQDQLNSLREPLLELAKSPASGVGFYGGIVAAIWSSSKYLRAFGQAINKVFDMAEGRALVKHRIYNLLATLAVIAIVVSIALCIVGSTRIIAPLGLTDTVSAIWAWARFPIAFILMWLLITVLYNSTSNVKRPFFNWSSLGALIAIIAWVVLTALLYLYAVVFGGFSSTYGSLAGVLVVLFWLWLSNIALLFGAQFDAETERARQLQAGIAAEDTIQLPPRDTRLVLKRARMEARFQQEGRKLRRID